MEKSSLLKRISNFPIHPILLSIYPIIFVYSRNLVYTPFKDTIRLLSLSISVFTVLLFGFYIILRDWGKAGLLSSILSVLFYSFGHITIGLEEWLPSTKYQFNITYLAWGWLFLFFLISFLIVRNNIPVQITHFINLISVILVIMPLISIRLSADLDGEISPDEKKHLAQLRGNFNPEGLPSGVQSSRLPDIYYIILDGYVRSDLLNELYGYDNSYFLEALEQRGFYVISSSNSNYLNTNYSLNSSLNLSYVHEFPKEIFNEVKYNLRINYVRDFLRELGYQMVVFDSGTNDTNNQVPDIFLAPIKTAKAETTVNAFEQFFIKTTVGILFFKDQHIKDGSEERVNIIKKNVNHDLSMRRNRINYAIRHLPDFSAKDGHYYLFSHLLLPHIPFLFGPNGEDLNYHENLNLYWYEVEPENYIEYYTYQIDYLNKAVLDSIDAILTNTKKPVIIIIQADHGDEYFLDRDNPTYQGVNTRSAILNAIYFSDQIYDDLYPTMSPVNTFRVIFNHWFGTNYSLLPDTVWFHEHPAATGINEKPEFLDSCAHFKLCLPSH